MNWYRKDMESIGFRGSNLFKSNWEHFWFREVPEKMAVYIFDALDERVMHFNLSAKRWKLFKANELGLVPVGCCGLGDRVLEDPEIDFEGDTREVFKSKKKFLSYLNNLCTE